MRSWTDWVHAADGEVVDWNLLWIAYGCLLREAYIGNGKFPEGSMFAVPKMQLFRYELGIGRSGCTDGQCMD